MHVTDGNATKVCLFSDEVLMKWAENSGHTGNIEGSKRQPFVAVLHLVRCLLLFLCLFLFFFSLHGAIFFLLVSSLFLTRSQLATLACNLCWAFSASFQLLHFLFVYTLKMRKKEFGYTETA